MENRSWRGRARQATPADVGELVRLRAVMLTAMGESEESLGARWREAAISWFADQLTAGVGLAAFVVDEPAGGVVAVAVGLVESRAPSGSNPSGQVGRIFNVATDPDHRHQGLARECTLALLAWFSEHTDVGLIELSATPDGDDLYRSLGFRPVDHPMLRLRLSR